jgi:hypothetical protein
MIGVTGFLLLLITTWPIIVSPRHVIRALGDLFGGTAVFGMRAAGMLYTSLQYIFGNELDNFEIFSLAWPVLAATNILALLTIKQGITLLKNAWR